MKNGPFVQFMRNVGIICGATIAAGTVLLWIGGWAWGYAMRPITARLDMLDRRDSLLVSHLDTITERQALTMEALLGETSERRSWAAQQLRRRITADLGKAR